MASETDGSLDLQGDLKDKIDEIVDHAIQMDDSVEDKVDRIGLRAYTDSLTSMLPVRPGSSLHNYILVRVKRRLGVIR